MATLMRSEIIAEARTRAGRKAQEISLVNAFDFILKEMSEKHPILRHCEYVGTTVAERSWVTLPPDYRSREQMFFLTFELDWLEPEDLIYEIRTSPVLTAQVPSYYSVLIDEGRIYMHNPPAGASAFYFYYAGIHPKANKTLSFTSGGTFRIETGHTVTGATSGKTMVVEYVRVTSGSWENGDAAGYLIGNPSGAFQSENLNVGTDLNVATIAADAAVADNFQHFFGETFDEVLVEGITWKCLEYISGLDPTVKKLAKLKEGEYNDLLTQKAGIKTHRELRTGYRDF